MFLATAALLTGLAAPPECPPETHYFDEPTGICWAFEDLDNSGDELDIPPASDTGCADPALDAADGSGCIPTEEPTWNAPGPTPSSPMSPGPAPATDAGVAPGTSEDAPAMSTGTSSLTELPETGPKMATGIVAIVLFAAGTALRRLA